MIVAYLGSNQTTFTGGGHLTPSRWQQLGLLGFMDNMVGRFSPLH